jgi:predicted HAD superfamily phosphohydrolase
MGKARQNDPAEPPAETAGKKKRFSLMVSPRAGELVQQLAALRRVSVEELFEQRDVDDFFTHLALAEAQRVTERLKSQPKR